MSAGACSRGAAFAGGRLGCARRTRGIERCRVRAGFRTAERAADFGRATATLAGGGGGVGDTAAAGAGDWGAAGWGAAGCGAGGCGAGGGGGCFARAGFFGFGSGFGGGGGLRSGAGVVVVLV